MEERAEEYIKLVCSKLTLPVLLVKSKSRKREYCEARQLSSYVLSLYTTLSQQSIADLLSYKDHASVWRDRKQVPILIEVDKKVSAKFLPILQAARELASEFERRDRALKNGSLVQPGDVCWFWNEEGSLRFLSIGILDRQYLNEEMEKRFVARESPLIIYSNCVYAGEKLLPDIFDRQALQLNAAPSVCLPVPIEG